MEIMTATRALDSLAHPTRLDAFRLLVRAGLDGMPAGDIAGQLGVRQNTMSSHLHRLRRAGLVGSERDGRKIVYRADFDALNRLILYLVEDCCAGDARVCGPVFESIRSHG